MMETTADAQSAGTMPPQDQLNEDVATVEQSGIKVRVTVTDSNNKEGREEDEAGEAPLPGSHDSTEDHAVPIKKDFTEGDNCEEAERNESIEAKAEDLRSTGPNDSIEDNDDPNKISETDNDHNEEVEGDESVESPLSTSEAVDRKSHLDSGSLKLEADDKTDATVATSCYMIDSPISNPASLDDEAEPQHSVTIVTSSEEEEALDGDSPPSIPVSGDEPEVAPPSVTFVTSGEEEEAAEHHKIEDKDEVFQEELQNSEPLYEEKNESRVDDGDGDDNIENNHKEKSLNEQNESPLLDVPVTPMSTVCPWSADPAYDYENLPKMEIIPDEPVDLKELQIGDHVYQWRSWIGIPGVFQHHGIVIDVEQVPAEDDEEEDGDDNNHDDNYQDDFDDAQKTDIVQTPILASPRKPKKTVTQLTIADFANIQKKGKGITSAPSRGNEKQLQNESRTGEDSSGLTGGANEGKMVIVDEHKSLFSLEQRGNLRVFQTTETQTWYKVHYEAPFWKRQVFSRSGTCTSVKSDPVGLVLARVHFILDHPEVLPDYHVLYANCECVAMWCKTGQWSTLQAGSFLEFTAAGQAKSAATMASAAAHTQVAVPANGLWGWLGYTTKVSLMTAQPMVVPALATYGIVTAGAPALLYKAAKNQWKQTTNELQAAFWEAAMESPDKFSENMAEWSQHV